MRMSGFSGRRNNRPEENDLGFGNKLTTPGDRLLNQDGSFNVVRKGRWTWNPYQSLVEMSWGKFMLLVLLFYISANFIFATFFYLLGPEQFNGLAKNTEMLKFADLYFFSAQTLTTVGYGHISPHGVLAGALASLEALLGLMTFAIATGLLYARFSRPKGRMLFSKKAVISPFREGYAFMFRIANLRNNSIINLEAKVTMAWLEEHNGHFTRKFLALPLDRDKVNLFPLNWTIVHPIDETSPLYGKIGAALEKMQPEFVILISGFDETFSQNVHSKTSYVYADLVCNGKFKPMYHEEDGHTVLQLDLIDDIALLPVQKEVV
jgi:inward rectifier potassium channel